MCGISVAVNTLRKTVSPGEIKRMNDKVNHRGPDDEGYYFGEHFAFGHRRLSIIDLSRAGHQPMQRGHLWITYNGEVYNYIELREELKKLGHLFQTATDTEVILAAYEQWGLKAFEHFNGMWAFAIYDSKKNEIILCRDHFGIKPLCFTKTATWFLAGSEIKQFTVFDEFVPILNKKTAVNFLANGLLNYSDETFFESVNELRPGHYLKYNLTGNNYVIEQWYNLSKECGRITDDYETAVKKVNELFTDSVRLRMRSDVRVGSCLSGGIDSSSIVCGLHQANLANKDFVTITSCYAEKGYNEEQYSDEVNKVTGYPSHKVYPDLNKLWTEGDLDTMLYHQDQPVGSASHYSEFSVFNKAREHNIIVMLDGQGADEFLCGYGEFFILYIRELLRKFKYRKAIKALKIKATHNHISFWKQLYAFLETAYGFSIIRVIKKIIGKTSYPWLEEKWKKIARQSIKNFDCNNIRDLSIAEIVHSSIPYQLHSEDRNSMLFSIESRLPYLDHRLVEYCIGLPSDYKIRNGYTKAVLRDAIDELPESIKKRKDKMGFVAPDIPWMLANEELVRKDLEQLVNTTGIFSQELLKRFDRFTEGKLGYEPVYFRAMVFKRFCHIYKMNTN